MQRRHTLWRDTQWSRHTWLWVVSLGVFIGASQSYVSAAEKQRVLSPQKVAEERFLQQFISQALDQKEAAPNTVESPSRQATTGHRDVQSASSLQSSNSDLVPLPYTRATATMILALGATLAVFGVSAYGVRRYLLKPRLFGKHENPLRVVARVSLTPKAAVALLQAPGKLLVIGITGSALTALGEIPLSAVDEKQDGDSSLSASFAATLEQQTELATEQESVHDPLLQVPEHIQRKVSSLKQL